MLKKKIDKNEVRATVEGMLLENPESSIVIQADMRSDSGVMLDVIDEAKKVPAKNALYDVIVNSIKYVFPVRPGRVLKGVATVKHQLRLVTFVTFLFSTLVCGTAFAATMFSVPMLIPPAPKRSG